MCKGRRAKFSHYPFDLSSTIDSSNSLSSTPKLSGTSTETDRTDKGNQSSIDS